MDINHSYSRHQRLLMRADTSTSRLGRTRLLAAAGLIANQIRDFQLDKGALAAPTWLRSMGTLDQISGRFPGYSA